MTPQSNDAARTNEYQRRCAVLRKNFAERGVVQELFFAEMDPTLLKLFMIYWSSLSAGLTEPIPQYLKRAGDNCAKAGEGPMADFFLLHASEEDGHENWARVDTEKLVERWNAEEPRLRLSADVLLENRISPAVKRYHSLHERVIEGPEPWCELAIDVEIELISMEYGPRLIQSCIRSMGKDALKDMSFLREHVQADVGHTDSNFAVLHELLVRHPAYVDGLVDTAAHALESYADFLDDALGCAKNTFARISKLSRAAG